MSHYEQKVVVDLGQVDSVEKLLNCLGETFEFGGPNGNVPVTSVNEFRGWGQNWDALLDCLCCLDSGGIWGTSRRFAFPLQVRFTNSASLGGNDPVAFRVLAEILAETQETYAAESMIFDFEVV